MWRENGWQNNQELLLYTLKEICIIKGNLGYRKKDLPYRTRSSSIFPPIIGALAKKWVVANIKPGIQKLYYWVGQGSESKLGQSINHQIPKVNQAKE